MGMEGKEFVLEVAMMSQPTELDEEIKKACERWVSRN
jgi:hypothetical protein